jgi:hypothetical protein
MQQVLVVVAVPVEAVEAVADVGRVHPVRCVCHSQS